MASVNKPRSERVGEQRERMGSEFGPKAGHGSAQFADPYINERRRHQVLPPLEKDGAPTLFEGTEFVNVE